MIKLGDCRDYLQELRSGDFVVSDPPFGLDGEELFDDVLEALEMCRGFPMLIILDWRNSHAMSQFDKIGELIWEYGWVSGGRARAKHGFFSTHNTVHLIGKRTDFRFINGSIIHRGPGLSSPRQTSFAKKSGHPYEKPVKLMECLINGCVGAKRIVDPFMGSGSTGIAAAKAGIDFLGIEKKERWFRIAEERLLNIPTTEQVVVPQ